MLRTLGQALARAGAAVAICPLCASCAFRTIASTTPTAVPCVRTRSSNPCVHSASSTCCSFEMNLGYVFLVGASCLPRPGHRAAFCPCSACPPCPTEWYAWAVCVESPNRRALHTHACRPWALIFTSGFLCAQAMGAYFDRDTVALPGISKFFRVSGLPANGMCWL